MYNVKEIFGPTIQGEGGLAGTVCFFLRFAGCNQWSGKEKDRASSQCPFCDTDFINGHRMNGADILRELLPHNQQAKWLIVTGGEPMLQYTQTLNKMLREQGWSICVETNGTVACSWTSEIDHVTLSPKTGREKVLLTHADSLKVLYPNTNTPLSEWEDFPCRQKYIQPVWRGDKALLDTKTLDKLYGGNGEWKLSLQLHKIIGVE